MSCFGSLKKNLRKSGNVKTLCNISKTKYFYILRKLCPVYNNVPQAGIMVCISHITFIWYCAVYWHCISSLFKVFSVLPVQGRRVMGMYMPLALLALFLFCSICVLSSCAYFLSLEGFGLHLTTSTFKMLVHKPSLYSQRELSAWS